MPTFCLCLLLLNILRPVSIYGLSMLARVGRLPMSCNSEKRVADYSWVFWCEILQLDALPANPTAAAMLKAAVNGTSGVKPFLTGGPNFFNFMPSRAEHSSFVSIW